MMNGACACLLAYLLACLLVNPCVRLLYACWRSLVCVCMLVPRLLLACLIASACLLCFTHYDCVPVHVHAQTQVELDRKAVLVFSGSAEHTASPSSIAKSIKASITTSMTMSTHGSSISRAIVVWIENKRVCCYRPARTFSGSKGSLMVEGV